VEDAGELASGKQLYDKIIFPGDGHFGTTMASLDAAGYTDAIKSWIAADKPFLGICIGLQVLFESSEEAPGVKGLGVLKGQVKRFNCPKVPQIGWNSTQIQKPSPVWNGITSNTFFYYIHSYYSAPENPGDVSASADYSLQYCSAAERGNLFATQFHPEKSGEAGLHLLGNWLALN
jgi:imidazole glycerol phosphate synthase glutamine amidotransferase subunit